MLRKKQHISQTTSPMPYGSNDQDTIRYLDEAARQGAAHKAASFDRLGAAPGQRLLDLGCGTGDDVRTLAERVGAEGEVIGVDHDAAMLKEARHRADGTDVNARFVEGVAGALPFVDAAFDGSRSERVFQHLPDPGAALVEMKRVTREGGRVVVLDVDWDTVTVRSQHPHLTRTLVHFACDRQANGQVGRALYELFVHAGFENVECEAQAACLTDWAAANELLGFEGNTERAVAAGIISSQDRDAWLEDLRAKAANGTFLASITGFCVSATR